MQRVTIRLPADVVRAYDRADGNRSKVMRRRLSEAVADGEVSGVPDDLRMLAERETIKDRGKLTRERGKFKEKVHRFFKERWEKGATTADDAESLAESWRQEAALYGDEHLAFVDAVAEWYADNYDASESRPTFPPPSFFVEQLNPGDVDPSDRLVRALKQAADTGKDRETAVETLSGWHPRERVEAAADAAYGDREVVAGEQ